MRFPILIVLAVLATPAAAEDARPEFRPAKGCTAKTAEAAEVNVVAAAPDAWAGKCVKVTGWWRDIGIYATRGEAFQPDALSIVTLDERRLGLYLSDKDAPKAPARAAMAEAVGTVGHCASLGKPNEGKLSGYCEHKSGAFLAVAKIEPAK